MKHPEWKIHGEDTLAAYLPDDDFKGVLEKRMAVPPDHLAVFIRDGQIVEAAQGMHLSVGGLWQSMKNMIGGKHAMRMLIADLKPFPINATMAGFSKDKVEISAEIAIEFQLNPEKPLEVMGLVANNRTLTRADVYERVQPHLKERILLAELVQHQAEQLRANSGLQDRIQAEIMKEVERVVGDLGLMVRAVSVNWGTNDDERQAIEQRRVEREDRWEEFQHRRTKRELERQHEVTVFRLETDLDLEKVKAANENELEKMLLGQSIELRDARDAGDRLKELKDLQHELELSNTRRLARYDERIGDESNQLEVKKLEIERKKLEIEFQADERKMQLQLVKLEREMEIDLQSREDAADLKKLGDLADLDERKRAAAHARAKDEFQAKHEAKLAEQRQMSDAEIARLSTQAAMSPEQLLAIQAGLSPAVANVFAERAKADAATGKEREALLRELVEMSKEGKTQSEEQARAMFDKAIDRLADVGAAAAGNPGRVGGSGSGAAGGPASECPECHHQVPHSDRFCKNCGHKMRT
ncbi:MAG: hypothetical protein H6807_17540 [Planctomycetes bacterium]|nr:hypothetical protein [Planctomycetota bacterium]